MAVATIPTGIIFGVPDEATRVLPIRGLPEGATVKLRFRPRDWGRAFIKTSDGIRHFVLREKDGALILDPKFEQGANVRRV